MSLTPTALQWPGPMFSNFELPYADTLTAGIIGSPVSLSGTDPIGYARDVAKAWTGGDANKIGSEAATPATPAGFSLGDIASPTFWKRAGISTGGAVLAIALVVLGLYFLVRGGD